MLAETVRNAANIASIEFFGCMMFVSVRSVVFRMIGRRWPTIRRGSAVARLRREGDENGQGDADDKPYSRGGHQVGHQYRSRLRIEWVVARRQAYGQLYAEDRRPGGVADAKTADHTRTINKNFISHSLLLSAACRPLG